MSESSSSSSCDYFLKVAPVWIFDSIHMASTFDCSTEGTPLIILCAFLISFFSIAPSCWKTIKYQQPQAVFAKEQQCERSNNFSREQTHYWWVFFSDLSKGTTAEACLSGKMLEYQRVCMWMMKKNRATQRWIEDLDSRPGSLSQTGKLQRGKCWKHSDPPLWSVCEYFR